ncbi:sigma-70 family RNA polymerase sigma factor [uncultured Algibacter sp.]|uniref:RNA polymerase sigma factor n=1 Tax=uncultured Algibacter sp. TaxID=298659 RepID=UPI0026352744|nr:sigma-70 family RNA polymerase sigma factor [uncultured Algibacter sp.]
MGKSINLLSQSELVCAIKSNESDILKHFYTTNYKKVEFLILKNSGSIEHAKDIYQEAFISVWTQIKNDKFIPKNDTALQGYLYQIAKNKWMDVLRSKSFRNSKSLDYETLTFIKDETNNDEDTDLKSNKLKLAMETFKNLGQPCKQLLSIFYFEKKSLKEIASELKIEENTARNKKYRCMEKLRAMVLVHNN